MKRILSIIFILILAGAGMFLFQNQMDSSVEFILVSEKSEYQPSEKVVLTAIIKNNSLKPVTVSAIDIGNISIEVWKDGVKMVPDEYWPVAFIQDPHYRQEQALQTIAPGDSASFQIAADPSREGISISYNKDIEDIWREWEYNLSRPGSYSIRARYQYVGSDNGKPNVYRGKLESNTAAIQLLGSVNPNWKCSRQERVPDGSWQFVPFECID